MSNAEDHDAEQAAITAACVAGTCDHPECNPTPCEVAQDIIDAPTDHDDNRRRAARAILCYLPAYEDEPSASLSDFLCDAMHLCDLAGWDFEQLTQVAHRNYRREVTDLGIASDNPLAEAIDRA